MRFCIRSMFSMLVVTILLVGAPLTSYAIQDGDYRLGVLAGNMEQGGTLKDRGSLLGYGLGFGYMFTDDMLFDFDIISGSSKLMSQSQINIGISYYYAQINTAYFNLSGGMNIINNGVKYSDSETISTGASGLYLGLGLDYDISARFTAGFQFRYSYLKPSKKLNEAATEEVSVTDSVINSFFRLSYVF